MSEHSHSFEQRFERSIPSCTVKVWECPCGAWNIRHFGCHNQGHTQYMLVHIDDLQARITELEAEVERLRNYKTAYENLKRVDRQQIEDIAQRTRERDDLQAQLRERDGTVAALAKILEATELQWGEDGVWLKVKGQRYKGAVNLNEASKLSAFLAKALHEWVDEKQAALADLPAASKAILAAAEREPVLREALEAREQARLVKEEYYRQCDLGQSPSEGWMKLGFVDVTKARLYADELARAALTQEGE